MDQVVTSSIPQRTLGPWVATGGEGSEGATGGASRGSPKKGDVQQYNNNNNNNNIYNVLVFIIYIYIYMYTIYVCMICWYIIYHYTYMYIYIYWMVVYLPIWKTWVRQLGWWNSQLNVKIKFMFRTTNQVYNTLTTWWIFNKRWGIINKKNKISW